MKIKFIVGDLTIVGFGKAEKDKIVTVSNELGANLINDGIAIEVKVRQNKEEDKNSKE